MSPAVISRGGWRCMSAKIANFRIYYIKSTGFAV
jgi:hypothetical protein